MPYWNEELQQWGYLYHEEVSSFQWLGIRRDLMGDSSMQGQEVLTGGYGAAKMIREQGYDRNPTLRQRITERRKFYTSELEKLNNLEKLLDGNPGIEQFQDLISKTQI